jgi:DNA-directed RNA polymerase II subunit RPB1
MLTKKNKPVRSVRPVRPVPLTPEQIKSLLQIVACSPSIPKVSALAYQANTQRMLLSQLKDVKLVPGKFEKFKKIIQKKYRSALIQPGESVGILCAQSIGEMNTQMTLNSFHHAGISEAAMTAGVPRFQELLSATQNPKIVNATIYFIERPRSLVHLLQLSKGSLKYLTLEHITTDFHIHIDNAEVIFIFNWKIMYRYGVYPADVCIKVRKEFGDIRCEIDEQMRLVVSVNVEELEIPDDQYVETKHLSRSNYISRNNAAEIYLEEVAVPALQSIAVSGIKGVTDIFYESGSGDHTPEWFLRTVGVNYKKILTLPTVDTTRTISNNVWDIYGVLGIEAAREALRLEFTNIMGGLNPSHTLVLVSRMTFSGSISSISRYTLKNECSSILGKASFEESLENFLQASINGSIEKTTGNSASIVCGKKTRAGTGFMDLKIDLNQLINS